MQQDALIKLILFVTIFATIAVFIFGYKRKAVIYMDSNDLGMNILPLPLLMNGSIVYLATDGQNAKIVAAYVTGVVIFAVMLFNFYKALKFNFFLPIPLNIFVALVKSLVSIFSLVFVPFWISSLEDHQGPKSEKAVGGLFMALLTTLTGHLINGKEVYVARGCSDGVYERKEGESEKKST